MGMFDYVKCDYPLPDKANELEFQTKDTPSQYLDKYNIDEDGTLWRKAYEDATVPAEAWEPVPLTGEIVFYAEGYEFSAYFVRGLLKHLETLGKPSLERKTNEGED